MDARRFLADAARGVAGALLFLAAALLSRATVIIDPGPSSLMWPAAGVAVVWFLTRGRRGLRVLDIVLLCLVQTEVALLAGGRGLVVPVVVGSAVLGTLAIVVLVRRLEPSLTDPTVAPLRTPRAVVRFLVGAVVGCAVGVAIGTAGLAAVTGGWDLGSSLFSLSRNVCGVLAVGVPGLLLVDHLRTRPRRPLLPGAALVELVVVCVASAAVATADWLSDLPLTFLLPVVTVWAATRFQPLVVSLHALLGGAAIIWLTHHGHGPFAAVEPMRTAALLAQVFISATLIKGLLLAASREANRMLEAERTERAQEQRDELLGFARRAAHDLQGPLAVIEGWSAELARAVSRQPVGADGDVSVMVGRIQGAAVQARALVSDILTDAASRDRAPVRERVDLTELARDAAETHAGAADIVVLEAGIVRGDPALLRQLLANLLDNAVKYVHPGETPRVTIGGRFVDDHVVVWIADLGVGIPAGQHERIFDEFERASEEHPGTGLGLSICRRIVERHGGTIRALDRDDGRSGAVFEVTLPAWGARPPSADLATVAGPDHRTKVTT